MVGVLLSSKVSTTWSLVNSTLEFPTIFNRNVQFQETLGLRQYFGRNRITEQALFLPLATAAMAPSSEACRNNCCHMALSDAIDEYHSDIGVIPVVVCPDTPENTIKSTRTIDPSHPDKQTHTMGFAAGKRQRHGHTAQPTESGSDKLFRYACSGDSSHNLIVVYIGLQLSRLKQLWL